MPRIGSPTVARTAALADIAWLARSWGMPLGSVGPKLLPWHKLDRLRLPWSTHVETCHPSEYRVLRSRPSLIPKRHSRSGFRALAGYSDVR